MGSVQTAQLNMQMTVTETLEADAVAATSTVTHQQFNRLLRRSPTTTPAVSKVSDDEITLDADGSVDIDLTAAPGVQGAQDLTGLRMRAALLAAPDTNTGAVIVRPTFTNGYSGLNGGNDLTLNPGDGLLLQIDGDLDLVASGKRYLRFLGAEDDLVQFQFLFGPDAE
jgi:hypothetical protein